MSSAEVIPPEPRGRQPFVPTSTGGRILSLAAMLILLGFIALKAPRLWDEWRALQVDERRDRLSRVVGYEGISPNPSSAIPPRDWYRRDEVGRTFLWSGWQPGVGHGWFQVEGGPIDQGRLSGVFGRDVIRAIEAPIVETGGGPRWSAIPDEARVAAVDLDGARTAYPWTVLEKVQIVNDTLADRPALVVFTTPLARDTEAVLVLSPLTSGRRLTFAHTGYQFDNLPLLYDRGTEGLWALQPGGLTCLAGHHKGTVLPTEGKAAPTFWGDWRRENPKGRLVVGADRSAERPSS